LTYFIFDSRRYSLADGANQGAHKLAKEVDPRGLRTIGLAVCFMSCIDINEHIGVLTKPDRIEEGNEQQWLDYMCNNAESLKHGWYCIKQPDVISLRQGSVRRTSIQEEGEFFAKTSPWNSLPANIRKRLGVKGVQEKLEEVLSDAISKRYVSYFCYHMR
jgi:hypothetical protein